ncbi:uncharacterized protein BJ212DRAFT_1331502 [Suillus subaureus]|uniref:Uncharacterized protein n=1 Tax=Suillus subaureus TaxID=48587 RepID=A0A9P7ALL3_9AGAM|nr:uncharacterized protein BJ212DRAFT_1419460 [Suillus subaureus]XP_041197334.1 uncharacterized protein BJ212DRAFT_1331502 [Suillus subaureus]KAG1791304.1 hypothetical protein BJ212DRAFT_1419460 [Suillus subaureus]KAG1822928.1 hypothetical protein BJ212DRAFT_1331502 [Suillus subaureus]
MTTLGLFYMILGPTSRASLGWLRAVFKHYSNVVLSRQRTFIVDGMYGLLLSIKRHTWYKEIHKHTEPNHSIHEMSGCEVQWEGSCKTVREHTRGGARCFDQ